MSSRLLGLVAALCFVFLAGCESNNKIQKKPGKDNLTQEEAGGYLKELARQLAEGNSASDGLGKTSMSNSLLKASTLQKIMTEEKIALTELSPDVPEEIMVEGKPKTLVLEIFNEETLKASITSSGTLQKKAQLPGYGVIEDEAFYWDGASEIVDVPVYLSYDENGTTNVVQEDWSLPYASDIDSIDDQFNTAINQRIESLEYPLFVVSMDPVESTVEADTYNNDVESALKGYLVLKGLRLKVERDGWTNDELELWYGKQGDGVAIPASNPNSYYLVTNTIIKERWRMNGKSRKDASGVSRYFSDVNKKNKWYADQGWDVRLLKLSNWTPRTLVAWEDDDDPGRMDRSQIMFLWDPYESYDPLDTTKIQFVHGQRHTWQVWSLAYDSVYRDKITTKVNGWALDQDDRYSESGVVDINMVWVYLLHSKSPNSSYFSSGDARGGGLDDIVYRFSYSLE